MGVQALIIRDIIVDKADPSKLIIYFHLKNDSQILNRFVYIKLKHNTTSS